MILLHNQLFPQNHSVSRNFLKNDSFKKLTAKSSINFIYATLLISKVTPETENPNDNIWDRSHIHSIIGGWNPLKSEKTG